MTSCTLMDYFYQSSLGRLYKQGLKQSQANLLNQDA